MNLPAGVVNPDPGVPFSGKGLLGNRRKKIAIAALGESFSLPWVRAWTDTLLKLGKYFDLSIRLNYATVVCIARASIAVEILQETPVDYVLLVDDDNPPGASQIVQLIADLEANQHVDLVAGWYGLDMGGMISGQVGEMSFGRAFRVIKATFQRRYPADPADFFSSDAPELQEIDWTGLGMVLMRWELLRKCGPDAFLPEQEGPAEHQAGINAGFIFDDMHFCKVAKSHGARLFVDRRVRVPHLKLRDITALPPAKVDEAAAAPVAGTALEPFEWKITESVYAEVLVPKEVALAGFVGAPLEYALPSYLPFCTLPGCSLREDHPGGCYPGTANAAPAAEPLTPEAK